MTETNFCKFMQRSATFINSLKSNTYRSQLTLASYINDSVPEIEHYDNSQLRQKKSIFGNTFSAVATIFSSLNFVETRGLIKQMKFVKEAINAINHGQMLSHRKQNSMMKLSRETLLETRRKFHKSTMMFQNIMDILYESDSIKNHEYLLIFDILNDMESQSKLFLKIQAIKSAFQELFAGTLPRELINFEQITQAMNHIDSKLKARQSDLRVKRMSITEFYKECKFTFYRIKGFLHINVMFELVNSDMMGTLYEILSFDLPVNGSISHITHLTNRIPKFIATTGLYVLEVEFEDDLRAINSLNDIPLLLAEESCIYAILSNQRRLISTLCNFQVITNKAAPIIKHIIHNVYLISNIQNFVELCNGSAFERHLGNPDNIYQSIIIEFPCNCRIRISKYLLLPHSECSAKIESDLYIVNIPILTEIFGSEIANREPAHAFRTEPVTFELTEQDEFDNLLELQAKIESMSISDFAAKINGTNKKSWGTIMSKGAAVAITCLFIIFTITSIALVIFMRQRITSAVLLTIATAANMPKSSSTDPQENYLQPISSKSPEYDIFIQYFMVIIGVSIILLIIQSVGKLRQSRERNSIFLEICSRTGCLLIKVTQLSSCVIGLHLQAEKTLSNFEITGPWYNSFVRYNVNDLKIKTICATTYLDIPNKAKLSIYEAYTLRRWLNHDQEQAINATFLFAHSKRRLVRLNVCQNTHTKAKDIHNVDNQITAQDETQV